MDGGQERQTETGDGTPPPPFMDVIVDILLALLVEPSAPERFAAEQVFRAFSSSLTLTGLGDLLRVVRRQAGGKRRKRGKGGRKGGADADDGGEDADEDDDVLEDDEDEDEDEDEEEEGEDGADEEEEEEEDEEGEDKEHEVQEHPEALRKEKANGKGEDADEDDEEDDNMDDEAMMRMDVHLANILRQRQRGSGGDVTKRQLALMHFKFRVLVLLEIFVRKNSASPLLVAMVEPLLKALAGAFGPGGSAELAGKIGNLIRERLCKGAKHPRADDVDLEQLLATLKRTMQLASRSSNKKVASAAASASHFLTKLLLVPGSNNFSSSALEQASSVYREALEDLFLRKRCLLSRSFFEEAFGRHPWIVQALLPTCIAKASDARTQFLRREALQLMASALKRAPAQRQRGATSSVPSSSSGQGTNAAEEKPLEDVLNPHLSKLADVLAAAVPGGSWSKPEHHVEALKSCIAIVEVIKATFGAACPKLRPLAVATASEAGTAKEQLLKGKKKAMHKTQQQLELLNSALRDVALHQSKGGSKGGGKVQTPLPQEHAAGTDDDSGRAGKGSKKHKKQKQKMEGQSP